MLTSEAMKMTTNDLHARAAALLAAADKYRRYGMGIADIDDGWETICDAGDLIRELLAENERLRFRSEKLTRALPGKMVVTIYPGNFPHPDAKLIQRYADGWNDALAQTTHNMEQVI